MKRGKLFILNQDVQRHKKGRTEPERKTNARMVQTAQVNSAYYDGLEAIQLSLNAEPAIPLVQQIPNEEYHRGYQAHAMEQIEVTDITNGFSDFMDTSFEDQFDEFFGEAIEKINDSKPFQNPETTNEISPKTKKQPPLQQSKMQEPELVPVNYSDPHHLFDQIGNNIAKTKAINLGEFSIEKAFQQFDRQEDLVLGDDEMNEDLNHLKNIKNDNHEK